MWLFILYSMTIIMRIGFVMKEFKLPPIGLRTQKTALAVFLCLLLFPNEPFFACMTSIFCLQNTLEKSYKIGFSRAYGTVHGACFGMAFLFVCRLIWRYVENPILCTVLIYFVIACGIIVVIYSCTLINRHLSIPLACIVFLAITTTHAQTDAFYYGFNRIIETFFGMGIGLLVNKYINPPSFECED